MADGIALKIKDYEPPKFMCATCDNSITELRAMKLPICDDCLKDLREIIKERRLKSMCNEARKILREHKLDHLL